MNKQIQPLKIGKTSNGELQIEWIDGTKSVYPLKNLRFSCPCAHCINEWNGNKIINLKSISDSVYPQRIYSIGLYAIGIDWSDSHKSGIYSYHYLYSL